MELTTIFLIWLVITIIDNLANRKKRRLPPPENPENSPSIEIPTLANDPNSHIKPAQVYERVEKVSNVERRSAPTSSSVTFAAQEVREESEDNKLNLNFTPSTVMNAFVLSEIISKPKAFRRR